MRLTPILLVIYTLLATLYVFTGGAHGLPEPQPPSEAELNAMRHTGTPTGCVSVRISPPGTPQPICPLTDAARPPRVAKPVLTQGERVFFNDAFNLPPVHTPLPANIVHGACLPSVGCQ